MQGIPATMGQPGEAMGVAQGPRGLYGSGANIQNAGIPNIGGPVPNAQPQAQGSMGATGPMNNIFNTVSQPIATGLPGGRNQLTGQAALKPSTQAKQSQLFSNMLGGRPNG